MMNVLIPAIVFITFFSEQTIIYAQAVKTNSTFSNSEIHSVTDIDDILFGKNDINFAKTYSGFDFIAPTKWRRNNWIEAGNEFKPHNQKVQSRNNIRFYSTTNKPRISQGFDSTLAHKLQRTLDSVSIVNNYRGISSAVIIPTQGTWLGASGYSYDSVSITSDMLFCIGSNTKAFISALILKLSEANLLSLDDPLYTWLPHYQNIDSAILIRQLLNHTSGIYNFTSYPGWGDSCFSNPTRYWTPEEIILKFVGQPSFAPGKSWQYSNTNYILAGMIIEAATHSSLSSQLRQIILNPLQLEHTALAVEEQFPGTLAHPWNNNIDIFNIPITATYSMVWSAGAIFSTAEDMARWYQLLFGGQLLNKKSLTHMLTFVPSSGYGLGIARSVINGRILWAHTGGIFGYVSCMLYDTTMHTSIAVLTNQDRVSANIAATALLNTVLQNVPTAEKDEKEILPDNFVLNQNYPNPFGTATLAGNSHTTIQFSLPYASNVTIKIFNTLEQEIATLLSENLQAGIYTTNCNAKDFMSGVYFYRLITGDNILTRKMIVVR